MARRRPRWCGVSSGGRRLCRWGGPEELGTVEDDEGGGGDEVEDGGGGGGEDEGRSARELSASFACTVSSGCCRFRRTRGRSTEGVGADEVPVASN